MPVNMGSTSTSGYLVTPTRPIRDNLQLFLDPADEKSYSGDTALKLEDLSGVNGPSGNDFSFANINNSDLLQSGYYNNFKFDGTNDYMSMTSNSFVNGSTGDFTIQMWVYRISQIEETFFSKGNYSSGNAKAFSFGTTDTDQETTGTKLVCLIKPTNTFYAFATTSNLATGQWNNIAWTYSRTVSNNKLYINGVSQSTTQTMGNSSNWSSAGTLSNPDVAVIGSILYGKPASPYYSSSSAIGPILFYNKLLDNTEILHNYRLHANRYGLT